MTRAQSKTVRAWAIIDPDGSIEVQEIDHSENYIKEMADWHSKQRGGAGTTYARVEIRVVTEGERE
jgi:hypothetical protein